MGAGERRGIEDGKLGKWRKGARTAFLCEVYGAVGGGAVGGEEGVEAGEKLPSIG